MQSHDEARDHAYTFSADKRLDEHYVRQNLSIVQAQLARPGVRLALVLNTALRKEAVGSTAGNHAPLPTQ
jgi:hypothetical protein